MKTFIVYFLSTLFVCAVVAFPANDPNDDVELIKPSLPTPKHNNNNNNKPDVGTVETAAQQPNFGNFDGVIISDASPGFFSYTPIFPYSLNFDIFGRVQDMFKSFRDYAWTVDPTTTDTDVKWLSGIPEDGKKNTTSRVEIIDGHKVITNDTIISHKTDFGDAIISIRVVDIEPLNSGELTTRLNPTAVDSSTSGPSKDAEDFSPELLDPATKENEVTNDIELSKLKAPKNGN